jgi:hypothetical protein
MLIGSQLVRTWKLEDAKNQFSRLVRAARSLAHKEKSLVAFMRESPLAEAFAKGELELVRSRDLPRDIPL